MNFLVKSLWVLFDKCVCNLEKNIKHNQINFILLPKISLSWKETIGNKTSSYNNLLCCLLIIIRVFKEEIHERQNHKNKQTNQPIQNWKREILLFFSQFFLRKAISKKCQTVSYGIIFIVNIKFRIEADKDGLII